MLFPSVTVVLLAGLCSAVAIRRPNSLKATKVAGAAYFISNEPTGNELVIMALDSAGQASFSHTVSVGGAGLHGNSSGPDALFTQDSVHIMNNLLFAVNPGSNTLTMFKIDSRNPVDIEQVGEPVSSGGDFPCSIAASAAKNQVCVLNGGTKNGVACFKATAQGLTPMANSFRSLGLTETNPPTGPGGTVSDIIFTADGKNLLVSVKGTPGANGFVASFAVDSQGNLSASPQKSTGGPAPFSASLIPNSNAVFFTDAGVGVETFNFAQSFANVQPTITPIIGQGATCWSSFSKKTGNFYVNDVLTDIVTEMHVDSNFNATVVNQYPTQPFSGTIDNFITTINQKDYLYVLQPNSTSVTVLALNAPGNATVIQTLNLVRAAQGAVTLSVNMQGMTAFSTI